MAKSWRLCFDAAASGRTLVLQDVFLGVNAHVNHDLAYALSGVSIDPDRASRYRDPCRGQRGPRRGDRNRADRRRSPACMPRADRRWTTAPGSLDEMLSMFSLQIARESAWESALGLANARAEVERGIVRTLIGSRAAVMSRLLLAPVRSVHRRSAVDARASSRARRG